MPTFGVAYVPFARNGNISRAKQASPSPAFFPLFFLIYHFSFPFLFCFILVFVTDLRKDIRLLLGSKNTLTYELPLSSSSSSSRSCCSNVVAATETREGRGARAMMNEPSGVRCGGKAPEEDGRPRRRRQSRRQKGSAVVLPTCDGRLERTVIDVSRISPPPVPRRPRALLS